MLATHFNNQHAFHLPAATAALAVPMKTDLSSAAPIEAHDLAARQGSIFTPTLIVGSLQPWQADNIIVAFNCPLANSTAPNFAAIANVLSSNDRTDISDAINQLAGIPVSSSPSVLICAWYAP